VLPFVALGVLVAAFLVFRTGMRVVGGMLGVLGLVIGAVVLVITLFGHTYRLPNAGMEPALSKGDRVLSLHVGTPGIGAIVTFRPPSGGPDGHCGAVAGAHRLCAKPTTGEARVTFVARIVAVGGDRVAMPAGRLVRNGRRVAEPYAQRCTQRAACRFSGTVTVPRADVFVLRDNRDEGVDSRTFGPVPRSSLTGRVVLRYWPLSGVGTP
jgi:signal peptidase I